MKIDAFIISQYKYIISKPFDVPPFLVLGASPDGLGALSDNVLPNCGVAAYGIPSDMPMLLFKPDPRAGEIARRVGEYTCSICPVKSLYIYISLSTIS